VSEQSVEAKRNAYVEFLKAKQPAFEGVGFEIDRTEINPLLFDFQKDIVAWAIKKGCAAIFAQFGLGKSFMQLEIARLVAKKTNGRFLIVCPLGVRQEFRRDAEKLGIRTKFIRRFEEVEEIGPLVTPTTGHGSEHSWTDGERSLASADTRQAAQTRSAEQKQGEIRQGAERLGGQCIYLTNYETIRDGKLDPRLFDGVSLDEASVLRGFGGTKTFRQFMRLFENGQVKYKFVATATPSPNDYIELLAYAAFLDVMDVGQGKTRFFKRDSTKADSLTIHPHKEREWWLWLSTWAICLQKPSDLGYSDEGYVLPELDVHWQEIPTDHSDAGWEVYGQGKLVKDAAIGVQDSSREKRNSLNERVAKMMDLLAERPEDHVILWHDLEDERWAIERCVPDVVSVYGSQEIDDREQSIIDFSDGKISALAGKPSMLGSGCNFQRHCAWEIFLGIGFKFNDFIQAIHRVQRFQQTRQVRVDLIYTEAEREIRRQLERKWEQHKVLMAKMAEIIREYGLATNALESEMVRSIGVERQESSGENFRLILNDAVLEAIDMPDDSVHLILTSIPFSTQYEYTPSYNDFGHTDSNEHFWQQMDFLIPEMLRVLKPGRIAAVHVKDRIIPGGMKGLGFQTVYRFHADAAAHFEKHGFHDIGMKTIVTDVVRENNQTYRLGWTEQCKDGSRMGVGMPEYLLLFRKAPTDMTNGYADEPVIKHKPMCRKAGGAGFLAEDEDVPFDENLPIIPGTGYSRSRWQIDAHGFERSSGDRLLSPSDLDGVKHDRIFKMFRKYSATQVYDYEHHVALCESLEAKMILPVSFMLLQPQSWSPDVWTDITRMLSLNGAQSAKGKEMHLCPMQFDIADRVIAQMSMPGEIVYDPFMGLGTVAYRALKLGRKAIGTELNPRYWADSLGYCRAAELDANAPTLFDLVGGSEEQAAVAQ
jgi:DNA modification methylase